MKSLLHTGASLALRVAYEDGKEKLLGFCTNFSYAVANGQKVTYTVDSPQPQEIAQGAAPSFVKGSLTLFLPKGTTPESVGLAPYRQEIDGTPMVVTKYIHFRIYDRFTQQLVFSCDNCKVGSYNVVIQARGIVQVSMQFDGITSSAGLTL